MHSQHSKEYSVSDATCTSIVHVQYMCITVLHTYTCMCIFILNRGQVVYQ